MKGDGPRRQADAHLRHAPPHRRRARRRPVRDVPALGDDRPMAAARRRRRWRGRRQRPPARPAQELAALRRRAAARRGPVLGPPARPRAPARPAPAARAPPGARAGAAAPPRPALAVLLRARVVAAEVLPRRLAVERAVGQQALLVQRRRGARVAALPARADPELVEGPVDRSAQPRLLRVDPEVVVDEVLLEGPRALLLGRARAVRLGAELRDDDGVVRIAVAHLVEVARELRAVEDGAARPGIPAEVLVDADDVERAVGLPAAR